MNIQYVISTMVFWRRENQLSFEQDCELIRKMGFGIELWPNICNSSECRYERKNWLRLKTATEGMLVSMRSRTDNPDIDKWTEQIQCAQLLGANIVTDIDSLRIPRGTNGKTWDFTSEIIDTADQNNVGIYLETGDLETILKAGHKYTSIRFCFDMGFANCHPEHAFADYVDSLAEKIAHVHLTDNYGSSDDHEPPGIKGGIDRENWDYLLKKLDEYDNDIVGSIEMVPPTPENLIRQATEFLFEELDWPNPPCRLENISVN
ncbi:MAG: sugar phosphate isomerase/epimerase [Phycisphaerae bacterium]|nr:sugar phosphate isomerase/epimerase [Phycisphaerae bacterium]